MGREQVGGAKPPHKARHSRAGRPRRNVLAIVARVRLRRENFGILKPYNSISLEKQCFGLEMASAGDSEK